MLQLSNKTLTDHGCTNCIQISKTSSQSFCKPESIITGAKAHVSIAHAQEHLHTTTESACNGSCSTCPCNKCRVNNKAKQTGNKPDTTDLRNEKLFVRKTHMTVIKKWEGAIWKIYIQNLLKWVHRPADWCSVRYIHYKHTLQRGCSSAYIGTYINLLRLPASFQHL